MRASELQAHTNEQTTIKPEWAKGDAMWRKDGTTYGLGFCICVVMALTFAICQNAAAAENAKIHIVEAKYGDFMGDKTCEPKLPSCEGTSKCSVEAADKLCKSGAAPDKARLQVIWDCGDLKHAAMAPRGKKVTLTCPYQPNLN
jgi:hypothetical protein